MHNEKFETAVTPTSWPRSRHRPSALGWWMGMAVMLALVQPTASTAGPLDDAAAKAAARFEPVSTFPPLLAGRLQDAAGPVYVAQVAPGTPQGTLYATTDKAGKARAWLLRDNAIVADLTAPASRDHMLADWPGSFAFLLGGLPVIAISWKFGNDAYGIEDFAFWAAEGGGRFLGGLPGSTRSPCSDGQSTPGKGCGRCAAASGIPINLRLAGLEPDHARFVQQRAANWYYYYASAAEVFEQDYLLTAKGLVPDGPARSNRTLMPLPQAQERVQVLLRDYFRLAKTQSRQTIAPEFLTCFEQLVDLAPDFAKGHYNVGCMNALLGNRKQAVASVSKALVIEPKYRKLARKDPDLDSIRDDPEFVRALAEPAK
jgi:tetratricopeptide (TPR) repeat protein